MIKHIWAVYFSPSGKTKQVTMAVAEGAAGVLKIGEIHTYDFTLPDKRAVSYTHLTLPTTERV